MFAHLAPKWIELERISSRPSDVRVLILSYVFNLFVCSSWFEFEEDDVYDRHCSDVVGLS